MKRIIALGSMLSVVLVPFAATADTAPTNVTVNANVTKNCLITVTPLQFAGYDPVVTHAVADLDATGGLSIACTKGLNPSVTLNGGGSGSTTSRRMTHQTDSSATLTYALFSNENRTANWGDTPVTRGAAATKAARDFFIYGRIPGGQDVPAGDYRDTVIATVNF